MKGMILKNWETLALTQGHSTAFCKSLGVPGKEQLLRQEGEKFIFSKTDKYAANKIYTRTLAGTPGKTAFVKEAWRADGQDEESLTANIAFMVGGPGTTIHLSSIQELNAFVQLWGDTYFDDQFGEMEKCWYLPANMSTDAARIFLSMTGGRICRLQDVTDEECVDIGIQCWTREGKPSHYYIADVRGNKPALPWGECPRTPRDALHKLWNKHVRDPKQKWRYNPWVQIIHFQRNT